MPSTAPNPISGLSTSDLQQLQQQIQLQIQQQQLQQLQQQQQQVQQQLQQQPQQQQQTLAANNNASIATSMPLLAAVSFHRAPITNNHL